MTFQESKLLNQSFPLRELEVAFTCLDKGAWEASDEEVGKVKLDELNKEDRASFYERRGLACVEER